MRVLEITVDLGPGVSPSLVETLVRGVRVAADVGRDATLQRVRRVATEQMKYPTDQELSAASELLPEGGQTDLRDRAARLAEARQALAEVLGWPLYRGPGPSESIERRLVAMGYERALAGAPVPWAAGGAFGLDVIDPDLYQALVAAQIARLAPSEITVREISYRNPLVEALAAVGTGSEALSKAGGAIETLATLGPRRRIKRAEAEVAESTLDDRIEATRLDTDLKREAVRQARLANDIAEEELVARRIQNATAIRALAAAEKREALAARLRAAGKLDEADVIEALEPGDADALLDLATRGPNVIVSEEPDPEPDRQGAQ